MLSSSDRPFGTEIASYQYVNLLLDNRHDVLFVHRHDYDLEHVELDNEKLLCVKASTRKWTALWRARAAVKKFRPDVIIVHNHFSRSLLLGKWIAPMVGVAHLDKFSALRRYDGAIALHHDKVKAVAAAGVKKTAVIYNTSRLENAGVKNAPAALPAVPTIGGIGSLVSHKGFSVFIEALEILRQRGMQYRAVLAGDGEQRRQLQDRAKECGLPCEFLGYISDVGAFYNSIDICCVPSLFEPFGLVLLDAMAMQKIIVASDIPSFRVLLNNGDGGRLFEANSAPQLADAIAAAVKNPSDAAKRAAAAKEHYSQHFSHAAVYEKLNEFLISVSA